MNETPGGMKRWLVAARTFALPASSMPVVFGTAMAVAVGGAAFRPGLFLAALLAMMILHTGANMLSDVRDSQKGLDREVSPVSGAIVRGWLTEAQVRRAAVGLLAVGSAIGLWLVARAGLPLLWIGLVGVALGVSYSMGPGLKYRALGDLTVFLNFGVLGALGAWTVQTGRLSWWPVLWAVPMSLLVVGILHANNWRDIATDRERAAVRTFAGHLGDIGSLRYYQFLVFGPFGMVTALVLLRWGWPSVAWAMPWPLLLVWLSFPLAWRLNGKALRRAAPAAPLDFITLDGATAQLNLAFGVLATIGLVLHRILERTA